MSRWAIAFCALLAVAAGSIDPAFATERLLKMRTYNFTCGTGQECSGWRHSFAFLDPAAKNAELPRETYVDIYTAGEIDDKVADLKTELSRLIDDALSRASATAVGTSDERALRDEIAADVVERLGRIMAEREAQMREWLRQELKDQLRAAGVSR